jgi:hypothetical protein
MWWQFRSAFVRKLGYIAAALLVGLLIHGRARAANFVFPTFGPGNLAVGPFSTGAAACAADEAAH